MNGMPHLEHLRSTSLFGLSSLMLIFDDESENDWNRAKGAGAALAGHAARRICSRRWAPTRARWARSTGTRCTAPIPQYDLMELKSLEDWVLEKQFKSVPNVVDVASFGGITREYQVRIDPDKLVAYGLSIGQVEQQLANNNVNAGGSFIEAGLQQINVRAGRPGRATSTTSTRPCSRRRTGRRCGSATSPPSSRAQDPAGPDRQGDSPRRRQDPRRRRRGGRHRAAAQGRRLGRHAGGHSREGRRAERRTFCRRE